MPNVSNRRPVIINRPAQMPHHTTKADLATAKKLKHAINEQLKVVRFGQPLAAKDLPKRDREGNWTAPNGDLLIRVGLSPKPPPGAADMPNNFALVDPKTNKFYSMNSGGITGMTFGHGPLSLPANARFKGSFYNQPMIQELTKVANGGASAKLPTRKQIETAIGAYNFHHMIKYSNKGPKDSEVLGRVKLTSENHPDGFSFTGLVLKSDPNKVVIMKTGGFAGITQYSNPLDVSRLPK